MIEDQQKETVTSEEPQYDEAQLQYAMSQLQSEQNLALGVTAGAVAAIVGAAIWALITVLTKWQIGWMAIGVGFLVGLAIRKAGKGIDKSFGIAGALLSLAGCGIGNFLAVCGLLAAEQGVGFFDVLTKMDLEIAVELMKITFNPMDLLFYGLAVYQGYKLSFRQVTEQDIENRINGTTQESIGG